MIIKYLSDPAWHDVCAGCSVMQVEDYHTQDDREGHQDHSEHDVVDNNWDAEGSLWDPVSQQQHEDSQSNEDGNGKSHFLSCKEKGQVDKLIMTVRQKTFCLQTVLY